MHVLIKIILIINDKILLINLFLDFKNSFVFEGDEELSKKVELFHKNEINNDLKFMETNLKDKINDKIEKTKQKNSKTAEYYLMNIFNFLIIKEKIE